MTIAPTVKTIALPTGVTLPYVEQGGATGTPVVLLHGITDSWRSWELVLPFLPESIHAFALTQRGHGDADRPEAGYSPADFSADIAAFLDAQGIERAVIVGHSLGSLIAQRFAVEYPERLLGLVLIGAAAEWGSLAEVGDLWDAAVAFGDTVDPEFVRAFQQSTLATSIPPGYFELIVQESLKLPAATWRALIRETLIEADTSSGLDGISAPTLIVWGDQDAMVAAQQLTLAGTIQGARLVVYAGAGHATHWEEPERFAADLTAFVDGITS